MQLEIYAIKYMDLKFVIEIQNYWPEPNGCTCTMLAAGLEGGGTVGVKAGRPVPGWEQVD